MSRVAPAVLSAGLLAIAACGARTSLDGASIYDTGGATGGGRGGSTSRGGGEPGFGGQTMRGGAGATGGSMAVGGNIGMGGTINPTSCGNGVSEAGEECDLGDRNEDGPALLLRQGDFSKPLSPIIGPYLVEDAYAYYSESSHTGLEALGASRLLLYRALSEEWLSLVMFHGIDFEETGIRQPPMSSVYFRITADGDAVFNAFVALSDEPEELQTISPEEFVGDWTFNGNSDGGVIRGLPFPGAWSVVITPSFVSNIDYWDFVEPGRPAYERAYQGLDLNLPVAIDSRNYPSACRLDCTVPRCGDGRLDGGEACDDGNEVDLDGCSPVCRVF